MRTAAAAWTLYAGVAETLVWSGGSRPDRQAVEMAANRARGRGLDGDVLILRHRGVFLQTIETGPEDR